MIFLDNASTTPCREDSAEIIKNELVNNYFNPSAKYMNALTEENKLNQARETLKNIVGATDEFNVVFTGSATEANNLVLSSSLSRHKENIISIGEHSSVMAKSKFYLDNGVKISYAPLNSVGEVDKEKFMELMTKDTEFVSIMLVSNETGAINDIKWISEYAKSVNPKVLIHMDAVQGLCKIKINLKNLKVDYMTVSSHKVHGPKGVGALIYRKNVKLNPEILGGGQEMGKRSGTENVPGILGFINSCVKLNEKIDENRAKVHEWKKGLISEIKRQSEESDLRLIMNGDEESASPYILSMGFLGVKGEVLLHALERKNILIGTGSACNSKHSGNVTLSAMGRSLAEIECNIRLSFSIDTTIEDEKEIARTIVDCAKKLKTTSKIKR